MIRTFLLGFSLALSGCALQPIITLNPDRLAPLAPHAEITSTPFIEQPDYQCGPASLAMVLNYYDHTVTVEELAPWVFTPDAKGSFPAEMDAVARQQGFISYPVKDFEAMLEEINAGHPILVLQNLGTAWYTMWHFAVVIGFDQNTRMLTLRSGDLPRRQTPFTLFETTWKRSQHWARVIVPIDQMPITAEPLTFIKVAHDFQKTGNINAALAAFKSATNHWPDEFLPRFAYANALQTLNQYAAARTQYETLLRYSGNMPEGWNNYAYALDALGCQPQALAAAQCAVELAPDEEVYRESLQDLSAGNRLTSANSDEGNHCARALNCH